MAAADNDHTEISHGAGGYRNVSRESRASGPMTLLADAEGGEQPVQNVLGVDAAEQPFEGEARLAQMLGRDLVGGAFGKEAVERVLGLRQGDEIALAAEQRRLPRARRRVGER